MTAFETAWIFLKNAPVPDYARPKIRSDGATLNEVTRQPYTQPPPRSAMEDEREGDKHNEKHRAGYRDRRYGIAERMPRPEVGSGESSFDSERMNTGTSVFNPTPSWQNMGQEANAANDSMQTFGTAHPPTSQTSQYPQYSPELYNALMGLQQPNDPSKAIPFGRHQPNSSQAEIQRRYQGM